MRDSSSVVSMAHSDGDLLWGSGLPAQTEA